MIRSITCLFLIFLSSACGPRYVDYFPYTDEGELKPKVVLVPPSNELATEIDVGLRQQLMHHGDLYVLSSEDTTPVFQKMGNNTDWFSPNIEFTKKFKGADYIVALDVIDQQVVPYERGKYYPLYSARAQQCNQVWVIKIRVRIFELCQESSRVIHQEVFCSNHAFEAFSGERSEDLYVSTATKRMIRDLAERIELVIKGPH